MLSRRSCLFEPVISSGTRQDHDRSASSDAREKSADGWRATGLQAVECPALAAKLLCAFAAIVSFWILTAPAAHAQATKQPPALTAPDSDSDHVAERNAWFYRGRVYGGRLTPAVPAAELRRRAFQAKLQMRAQRAATPGSARRDGTPSPSLPWQPLGPAPLASDASGNGTQDYRQVSGRATAVAIDPADPTGNTVYISGAQGGIWQSTNAANPTANNVTWTPLSDDQATLSFGALVIQPGNANPAQSLILAATGVARVRPLENSIICT
jgi:hypothetical protein